MAGTADSNTIFEAVCRAANEVFSTMLAMELRVDTPYTERDLTTPVEGLVSLIGLTGDWAGTGSISCSADFACKISSTFLMAEYSAVDSDVLDAIGEVTNMIIGNFKNEIENHVGPLGMSTPTVIFGRNFTTRNTGGGEWTVVPFYYGDDRMDVKVCIGPQNARVSARAAFSHPALQAN